jgi:hypothetical protein
MPVECFAKVRGLKREEIGVLGEEKKTNQIRQNSNAKLFFYLYSKKTV